MSGWLIAVVAASLLVVVLAGSDKPHGVLWRAIVLPISILSWWLFVAIVLVPILSTTILVVLGVTFVIMAALIVAGSTEGSETVDPPPIEGMAQFAEVAHLLASKFSPLTRCEEDQALESVTVKCRTRFRRIRGGGEMLVLESTSTRNALIIGIKNYWHDRGKQRSIGVSSNLAIKPFVYEDETMNLSEDDEVLSERWEHSTKNGERDFRYKINRQIYEINRFGVQITLEDTTTWTFVGLGKAPCMIVTFGMMNLVAQNIPDMSESGFDRLLQDDGNIEDDDIFTEDDTGGDEFDEGENDEQSDDEAGSPEEEPIRPQAWFEVLGVGHDAPVGEITAAWRKLMMQYHPDRVEGLGPEIKDIAAQKALALNAAYEEGKRLRRT